MDNHNNTGAAPAIRLTIAARSDVGRKRESNEDRVASDPERGVAVLADGMGGHNGGDVASELAVNTILHHLVTGLDGLSSVPPETDTDEHGCTPQGNLSREAIEQANQTIFRTAEAQPEFTGMGTTVVLAVIRDGRISIGHVGDSRLYRMRDGELTCLTRDHTLLQELVERGFYTPEEARESLNRNIVTRALGIEQEVTIDLLEEAVNPGDIYLLCSDGLTEMLEDREIAAIVGNGIGSNSDSVSCTAAKLVDTANHNGGNDNISAILIRVQPDVPPYTMTGLRERVRDWFRKFTHQ